MLTALDAVGAEYNTGTFSDSVGSLQLFDGLIVILLVFFFLCHIL